MRLFYKALTCVAFILLATFPENLVAQCTCSNGDPADSVVQVQTLSGSIPFSSVVNFSKFPVSTGSLSCVTMRGTVTTTINMDLVNRDSTSRITYEMVYTRVTSITAPGISVSKNVSRDYGPFDLGQATVDPDTMVHVGPDVVFNNTFLSKSTSNVVPYIGTGNLAVTYFNNGSFLMTQGNDNYGLDVAAQSNVTLRLSYYYCPNAVLATGIRSFDILRDNHSLSLTWLTENDLLSNSYSVELSHNGIDFTTLDQRQAASTGSVLYNYKFTAPSGENGSMYFRVRQTDMKGISHFSAVKSVSFSNLGSMSATLFPNPAGKHVQVQFQNLQSGTLDVDLVSTVGQVLQHNRFVVNKTSTLPLDLDSQPRKGMYWLRVRNLQTGEQSVNRLTFL